MAICTCPVSGEKFDSPLFIEMRSTVVAKAETNLVIANGRTVLMEIPQRLSGLSVVDSGTTLSEVRDQYQELGDLEYRVDYAVGWIYFNSTYYPDGASIDSISYVSRGVILYPISRIVNSDGGLITDGITEVYDDGILVSDAIGKFDFRQNIEVKIDPLDAHKIIINVDPAAGFGGAFIDLSDAPSTYVGQALKVVAVNSGETGVEFIDIADVVIDPKDSLQTYDSSINSVFGVVEPIDGSPEFNRLYGLSLNQEELNGDCADDDGTKLTGYTSLGGTLSMDTVVYNILPQSQKVIGAGGNSGIYKDFTAQDNDEIYVSVDVYISSYTSGTFGLIVSAHANFGNQSTVLADTSIIGKWQRLSVKINDKVGGVRVILGSVDVGIMEVNYDGIMVINTENTPLHAHTATQLDSIILDYFEGRKDIEDFELQSIGVQLLNSPSDWEQGSFDVSDNLVSATNRIRIKDAKLIQVAYDKNYVLSTIGSYTFSINELDSNGNLVNAYGLVSVDATYTPSASNVSQLRISLRRSDNADLYPQELVEAEAMLEEKTSLPASDYKLYNSPQDNFQLIANLLSVGTSVRDEVYPLNGAWWKDKYVNQYTLLSADFDSIADGVVNQRIFLNTFPQSDLIQQTDNVDHTLELDRFPNETDPNVWDTSAETNSFQTTSGQSVRIIVPLGTYVDIAAARLDLTGILTRYAVNAKTTTVIEKNGSLIQESNTTLIQLNNFATEYDITFATNQVAQIGINTDNINYIFDEIDDLEVEIAAIGVRLDAGEIQIVLNVLELVDHEARITAIETDIENPLSDESVPYAGLAGKYALSKDALAIAVHGINLLDVKDYKGGTLNNLDVFGKKISSVSTASYITQDSIGDLIAHSAYNASNLTFRFIAGNRYFMRVKMAKTSIDNLRSDLLLWYSDASNQGITTITSADTLEKYGVFTANSSLLANITTRVDAVGGQLDNLSWELYDITDTFIDGLTAEQINNRIEYIDGLQSVGSPVDYDQLQDLRNDWGNFELVDATIDKETVEGIAYLNFVQNGGTEKARVLSNLVDNKVHTILTHIVKVVSALGTAELRFTDASSVISGDLIISTGESGIFKNTFTSKNPIVTNAIQYKISGGTDGDYFIFRSIVLEGDHTNVSDETALKCIQEEEFGVFEVKGVFIESVGKNKFKLPFIKATTDGSGGLSASTTDLVTDMIAVLPSTEYTATNTIHSEFFIWYDINKNYLSFDTGNQNQSPSNAYYCRIQLSSGASTPQSNFETLNDTFQLELGSVATDYADFIKANAHINEEFGDVPDGTADDFDFVRTKRYLLESADITAITNLSTVQQITITKPILGSGYGDLSIEWTRVENWIEFASGTGDSADNIGKYRTFGANNDYLFYVALGTYATLGDAQTAFTDTKIRYKLATPLPRDGIKAPLLDVTGKLLTSVDATFTQESTSGITNYFTVTQPLNLFGQLLLNILTDLSQQKEINWNKTEIEKLTDQVIDLIDNQGYIPDLDTTATVIVDAINEILADLIIAESDISDNVTAIGFNTTHRGGDGSDHSNVATNTLKNSYPSGDATKVGHITVSAAVNLNKVAEYTEVLGTKVDVSNATTMPAANVTTLSTDGYDALDIELKFGDTTKTLRMGIGINGDEQVMSFVHALTTTSDARAIFKLHRVSSTSYTAYYGRSVSNTGSGSVHIATTSIDILKIYGVKFT